MYQYCINQRCAQTTIFGEYWTSISQFSQHKPKKNYQYFEFISYIDENDQNKFITSKFEHLTEIFEQKNKPKFGWFSKIVMAEEFLC